ncbi:hypothetical protein GW17_00008379, partial [Ensete ventricosum]
RNAVVTANAETQVVSPSGLQELIDAESGKHPLGRCFIRPSGTEDIIRVYAEASTQEAADCLARSGILDDWNAPAATGTNNTASKINVHIKADVALKLSCTSMLLSSLSTEVSVASPSSATLSFSLHSEGLSELLMVVGDDDDDDDDEPKLNLSPECES